MSEPTRPTCGTCPHAQMTRQLYLSQCGNKWLPWGAPYTGCYVAPTALTVDNDGTLQEARSPVESDSPGCIHHPDMPAYVEAWKLAREKPQ